MPPHLQMPPHLHRELPQQEVGSACLHVATLGGQGVTGTQKLLKASLTFSLIVSIVPEQLCTEPRQSLAQPNVAGAAHRQGSPCSREEGEVHHRTGTTRRMSRGHTLSSDVCLNPTLKVGCRRSRANIVLLSYHFRFPSFVSTFSPSATILKFF